MDPKLTNLSPAWLLTIALLAAACQGKDAPPPPTGGDTTAGATGDSAATSGVDSDALGADSDAGTDSDAGGAEPYPGLSFSGERPRNLLLLSMETVRRDDLGRYSGRDTSPQLDAWFERSVTLDNHRSCSNWTYPSFVCIYTGAFNEDWGVYPHGIMTYPDEPETLAEMMNDRGYNTRMVAAQFVLDPSQNLSQGFDQAEANLQWDAAEMEARTVDAVESLDAMSEPWFLHVHFFDPHTPYQAPASSRHEEDLIPDVPVDFTAADLVDTLPMSWLGWDEETRAAVLNNLQIYYDGDLRYMDEHVGAALSTLEDRGYLEDTLLVLITDHGEQFFEHDNFEHGNSLFGEETLSTAAFWARGLSPASVQEPTLHVDIVPTLLDAMGLAPSAHATGSVLGQAPPDRPLYSSAILDTELGLLGNQAIQLGDERLIYWWDGGAALYNLATDPGEQQDLYDRSDPKIKALWAAMAPYTAAMDASRDDISPEPVP